MPQVAKQSVATQPPKGNEAMPPCERPSWLAAVPGGDRQTWQQLWADCGPNLALLLGCSQQLLLPLTGVPSHSDAANDAS